MRSSPVMAALVIILLTMSMPWGALAEGPSLTIAAPADGLATRAATITVTGTTDGVIVDVNGAEATLSGGTFSQDVTLTEGINTILVEARDAGGNSTSVAISVLRDINPPFLEVTAPAGDLLTNNRTVHIEGLVETGATVTAGGQAATVSGTSFQADVAIDENTTAIEVVARDAAGNTATVAIPVTLDEALTFELDWPEEDYETYWDRVRVKGKTDPDATVTVNGDPVEVGVDGTFKYDYLIDIGRTNITIKATDAAGNVRMHQVEVKRWEWVPFAVPVELAVTLLIIGLVLGSYGGMKYGRHKERKVQAERAAKAAKEARRAAKPGQAGQPKGPPKGAGKKAAPPGGRVPPPPSK